MPYFNHLGLCWQWWYVMLQLWIPVELVYQPDDSGDAGDRCFTSPLACPAADSTTHWLWMSLTSASAPLPAPATSWHHTTTIICPAVCWWRYYHSVRHHSSHGSSLKYRPARWSSQQAVLSWGHTHFSVLECRADYHFCPRHQPSRGGGRRSVFFSLRTCGVDPTHNIHITSANSENDVIINKTTHEYLLIIFEYVGLFFLIILFVCFLLLLFYFFFL